MNLNVQTERHRPSTAFNGRITDGWMSGRKKVNPEKKIKVRKTVSIEMNM